MAGSAAVSYTHLDVYKRQYMCGEIEKLIDNGQCAEAALEYMCDMFISMFSATDDELTLLPVSINHVKILIHC